MYRPHGSGRKWTFLGLDDSCIPAYFSSSLLPAFGGGVCGVGAAVSEEVRSAWRTLPPRSGRHARASLTALLLGHRDILPFVFQFCVWFIFNWSYSCSAVWLVNSSHKTTRLDLLNCYFSFLGWIPLTTFSIFSKFHLVHHIIPLL